MVYEALRRSQVAAAQNDARGATRSRREGHDHAQDEVGLRGGALQRPRRATLDDLREAVTTLEDAERIARRVLGGAHPTTLGIGPSLADRARRAAAPASTMVDASLDAKPAPVTSARHAAAACPKRDLTPLVADLDRSSASSSTLLLSVLGGQSIEFRPPSPSC